MAERGSDGLSTRLVDRSKAPIDRDLPRAPESARPATALPDADAVVRDVQSVLAGAVERIQAQSGCAQVCAWSLRDDGSATTTAAAFDAARPVAPTRADFDRLAALPGACDLSAAPPQEDLLELCARLGVRSAAPVTAHDGTPLAVLVCGGEEASRPRALALLAATSAQLATPLSAAHALARLEALDGEVCRLDRLAALGGLSSEIAHELRNPLVSIKTFLQLLPERRDDPEFTTSFLGVARDELQRMERLLDVVLDHARPPASDEPVAVALVLEAVVELVRHRAHKRGIEIDAELGGVIPGPAIGDDALRQVVLNLAINAIDAAPDRGRVLLTATADAGGAAITVADDGPGVPEAQRARIFEAFVSTRSDRTGGLGLAICRRLVDASGGRIAVGESALGGAAFRVWLPAATG